MEGAILRLIHRAVDIILAFTLVPATGIPCDVHVDAVMIDNRRNCVEKGEAVLAGFGHDAFGETSGGERAGGDDDGAVGRDSVDSFTNDFNIIVILEML